MPLCGNGHGAKAYFGGFALVKLEAVPQPGYVLSRWQGRGNAFIADDHDDSTEERSLESEESPITNDEIWITMRDQDGLTSRDVTAVFCTCIHTGTVHGGTLIGDVELTEGVGYEIYDGPSYGCDNWIHKKIRVIGVTWAASHNYPFEVGQISKHGGGQSAGGSRSHQNGLDVDVRYIRADHQQVRYAFGEDPIEDYDQSATQELVNLFLGEGANLLVPDDRANLNSGSVYQEHDRIGHYHHFHVRFDAPTCSDY